MDAGPGLRERKKQKTRELIVEAARSLFTERGFDAVTVADVAASAEVSVGTVFNYFPTKEDLFFGDMQRFEAGLVEAVRNRPPGESVLDAFRRVFIAGYERLTDEQAAEGIAVAARIMNDSRTLQAREREIDARSTEALAALFATGTGRTDRNVEAWVVANALMGIHRALVRDVHRRVLNGERGRRLGARVASQGERAFALLENGLGSYARR
jgi:AcrR family transcriptional regulator